MTERRSTLSPMIRMAVLRLAMTVVLMSTATVAEAHAADVTALELPAKFTVSPEGERRLITIAPDGTIAALAQSASIPTPSPLALRWSPSGARESFAVPARIIADSGGYPVDPSAVVASRGVVYVTVREFFSGAYSGAVAKVYRWLVGSHRREALTTCPADENSDENVYGGDGAHAVAATFERTGYGSFAVTHASANAAPYAFVIDASGCHPRGRAVILGLRGAWASGYRGYLENRLAPTNYGPESQNAIAVRWHGARLTELGEGVAYAVTAHGLAVGATALACRDAGAVPQAVAWTSTGRKHLLLPGGERSVAYDVSDDATIVGTVAARDGEQHAFRARAGTLERLDDLPHPRDWRFESAYAIGADGTIVGIGTLHGRPTVFRWRE